MKKILILVLLILFCSGSVFGGEFEDTLKEAEQGDASAQWMVGYAYLRGEGVQLDHKQAFYWCKKAAEQGIVDAQFKLAQIYFHDWGVTDYYPVYSGNYTPAYKEAVKWYIKAAQQGHVKAQLEIAYMYSFGEIVTQDEKQAVYWWKKAAKLGSLEAQIELGYVYSFGKGIPQDDKKGTYWFKQAAEHENIYKNSKMREIFYNLGVSYKNGLGIPQDYQRAVFWLKKSAEHGHASAQASLGYCYYFGEGVPQNYKLAYVWDSLAATQGDKQAIKARDFDAKKLTLQQLTEAQEIAADIQYRIDNPAKSQEQQPSIGNTGRKVNGSGTGFLITRDGYVLTCHHVIKDANEVKISVGGNTYSAKLIRDDPYNDLALLKIKGSFPSLAFSSKRSAKMGQEVFTIGYPNPSLQGVSAKFTKGTINSLTGFQDDLRLYQISIPVQPGNSGGALLDENGNVLGIIMAMLDAKTTFKISGSLPQNVNYAVKSIYAQALLDTLPAISEKLITPLKSKFNVVDRVKKSTVMVLSYN